MSFVEYLDERLDFSKIGIEYNEWFPIPEKDRKKNKKIWVKCISAYSDEKGDVHVSCRDKRYRWLKSAMKECELIPIAIYVGLKDIKPDTYPVYTKILGRVINKLKSEYYD